MDRGRPHLVVEEVDAIWMREVAGDEETEHRASKRERRRLQPFGFVAQDRFQCEEEKKQLQVRLNGEVRPLPPLQGAIDASLDVGRQDGRKRRHRLRARRPY